MADNTVSRPAARQARDILVSMNGVSKLHGYAKVVSGGRDGMRSLSLTATVAVTMTMGGISDRLEAGKGYVSSWCSFIEASVTYLGYSPALTYP